MTIQEEGAEVNERGRSRDRGKKKGGAGSQTPGVVTVRLPRSGAAIVLRPGSNGLAAATVVGRRALDPELITQSKLGSENPIKQFALATNTLTGVYIGKVEIFDRSLPR